VEMAMYKNKQELQTALQDAEFNLRVSENNVSELEDTVYNLSIEVSRLEDEINASEPRFPLMQKLDGISLDVEMELESLLLDFEKKHNL
jgi:hypothetical protein